MEKIIQKHYSNNNVIEYEKNRTNKKWSFEQETVEKFIKDHEDIKTIIDAPLGTNRFGYLVDKLDFVDSLIGLELSDDMLKYSKTKGTDKLTLKKHDIIKDKCNDRADLVLIIRMLNLFDTENSLKIIDNLLPAANKYCIATLRYADEYSYIENKIHIQPLNEFLSRINKHNFSYEIFNYNQKDRSGTYSIIVMEKNAG